MPKLRILQLRGANGHGSTAMTQFKEKAGKDAARKLAIGLYEYPV